MPRITFTQTRVVNDQFKGTDKETRFEAGKTYELPRASCDRWKHRGVAVDAVDEGDGFGQQIAIPDDWRDLEWQDMKSLAARISPYSIKKKDEAIAAIEAELFRREPLGNVLFQQRTSADDVKTVYVIGEWPTKVEVSPELFDDASDNFSFDSEARTVTITVANGYAVYRLVEETDSGTAILALQEGNFEPVPAE